MGNALNVDLIRFLYRFGYKRRNLDVKQSIILSLKLNLVNNSAWDYQVVSVLKGIFPNIVRSFPFPLWMKINSSASAFL
jgi:hypothetical protein